MLADDDALVAGLFAVDGHVQVDDAGVLPLGEAGHLHRRAVGDLLFQAQQHFLPDNLGADLGVGLVGGHAVGEQLGVCSWAIRSSKPSPVRAEMGMMASKPSKAWL